MPLRLFVHGGDGEEQPLEPRGFDLGPIHADGLECSARAIDLQQAIDDLDQLRFVRPVPIRDNLTPVPFPNIVAMLVEHGPGMLNKWRATK